jgi:phage-related protein
MKMMPIVDIAFEDIGGLLGYVWGLLEYVWELVVGLVGYVLELAGYAMDIIMKLVLVIAPAITFELVLRLIEITNGVMPYLAKMLAIADVVILSLTEYTMRMPGRVVGVISPLMDYTVRLLRITVDIIPPLMDSMMKLMELLPIPI